MHACVQKNAQYIELGLIRILIRPLGLQPWSCLFPWMRLFFFLLQPQVELRNLAKSKLSLVPEAMMILSSIPV